MDKKRWLWKHNSSKKGPGETDSSGSVSSHSEQEGSKESPNGSSLSPAVTSKTAAWANDANCPFSNEQLPVETSKPLSTAGMMNDGLLEKDEHGENENIKNVEEGYLMSKKLSAALVNVNTKEDLVKQHAKVAEEAIAGWEKAENEVSFLKKQLEAATHKSSTLEDRVTHLDGALKECVRQLRQTREKQEENMGDAIEQRTCDLELAKIKLQRRVSELQSKLEACNAKSSVDLEFCHKVELLEKENMALRQELLAQSEELEMRTIERDLSTQAAETASKQYLESIKKIAKLEAECRRLKSIASRASVVNDHKSAVSSSFCVESFTDSQSDSGEQLNAVEIDTHKTTCSDPNKCEPSCSDSWASALIVELDQFKNEMSRQTPTNSVKLDLMDDFLEMERLVALPETKNESHVQESVVDDHCIIEKSSPGAQFEIMNKQMDELREKLEKVELEKAELEMALMKSEESIKESQHQMSYTEKKVEELQEELENAYKSKEMIENYLISMEAEAQTLSAKVDVLEAEVDKERAVSEEIAMKFKVLEQELQTKSAEVDVLEAEVNKERTASDKMVTKCKDLEEKLKTKSADVDILEAEVNKERVASDKIMTKCKDLEEELKSKSAKLDLLEAEVDKERAVSEEIAMKFKDLKEELESKKQEEILRSTSSSYAEKKIKQEDLALAAGKLAECQKTIASLGNQLKSLATLEDFFIDTASIPASPSLVAQASGELWKLHSNDTFSPKRDSNTSGLAVGSSGQSLNKNEESLPPLSSSSTSLAALTPNHVGSEKSRNGFAKFFSRTKSGIRLEI
ncbi:filament-like plant protein isoform X1 [Arachis ipaensis]|uniref:filament-like plant protein isoform X1 n=1 Tax=Arachis ipaensis TaxID=130454 RepID=UPI000A2B6148|nr:filament-like plant protein isoform X1 [Arachis ipaensis]XP_020961570.1 filament-like plant protein isoform X1 [Arachis ipaensis]XP_020961571.1 filament-like plant protein isoform X1 [Arachis ipaensis]